MSFPLNSSLQILKFLLLILLLKNTSQYSITVTPESELETFKIFDLNGNSTGKALKFLPANWNMTIDK